MAVAYGCFDELSNQLRFLLFEIGIGLSQEHMDYFISQAHKTTLQQMQHALCLEELLDKPLLSHHIDDLLSQLHAKANKTKQPQMLHPFIHWSKLRETANELIANKAMSQAYRCYWNNQLRKEISPGQTLWSYLKTQSVAESQTFLEQWANAEHDSLALAQVPTQLTRREVLQNLPQFRAKLSIHWGALKKSHAYISASPQAVNAILTEHFPLEYMSWREKLAFNHLNADDYLPIPIHSWQWRTYLQTACAQLIAEKNLILFPHHHVVMPSAAANIMAGARHLSPQIELSLAIYSQPAPSAPSLTEPLHSWVSHLLAQLPQDRQSIQLADEAIRIQANKHAGSAQVQQHLTVSIRQNPIYLLKKDQQLIPFTSALTLSPITNTPLLCELISASGVKPLVYFRQYAHKVLACHLYLLLQHGLSFSVDAQNTLLVIEQDKPQRLIIRTLDSLTISTHPLFNHVSKPEHCDQVLCAPALTTIYSHFIEEVMQNHLAIWIDMLQQYYALPAKELWQAVRQTLEHLLLPYGKTIAAETITQLKVQLFELPWQQPCTLSQHMHREKQPQRFVSYPNPLK